MDERKATRQTHRATDDYARLRRPHNQLKAAMQKYLLSIETKTASISEIRAATEQQLNMPPQSSYRSGLQDGRYFERVSRGVFRAVESAPRVGEVQ